MFGSRLMRMGRGHQKRLDFSYALRFKKGKKKILRGLDCRMLDMNCPEKKFLVPGFGANNVGGLCNPKPRGTRRYRGGCVRRTEYGKLCPTLSPSKLPFSSLSTLSMVLSSSSGLYNIVLIALCKIHRLRGQKGQQNRSLY